MQNAKGFGVFWVLVFLVVIGLVGFAGWRVYYKDQPLSVSDKASDVMSKPKKIVAAGDISCDLAKPNSDPNTCQQDATYELVQRLKPDAVLGLGDLQYSDGSLEKFEQSFAKNWGNLTDIFYPSPGNHEYSTPGAQGYFDYFGQSKPANPMVDISKGYYSFDFGNWHIVSLNSNCSEIGGCGMESEQLKWLEQDLKNNSSACTLAFWHHPRFTSGPHADDSDNHDTYTFWQKLIEHKVEVVLNGHDHLYERFDPQTLDGQADENGVRQFTVGTGGRSLYKKRFDTPNSQAIVDDSYGVLALTLDQTSYKWEFVSVADQVLDSGQDECI